MSSICPLNVKQDREKSLQAFHLENFLAAIRGEEKLNAPAEKVYASMVAAFGALSPARRNPPNGRNASMEKRRSACAQTRCSHRCLCRDHEARDRESERLGRAVTDDGVLERHVLVRSRRDLLFRRRRQRCGRTVTHRTTFPVHIAQLETRDFPSRFAQ